MNSKSAFKMILKTSYLNIFTLINSIRAPHPSVNTYPTPPKKERWTNICRHPWQLKKNLLKSGSKQTPHAGHCSSSSVSALGLSEEYPICLSVFSNKCWPSNPKLVWSKFNLYFLDTILTSLSIILYHLPYSQRLPLHFFAFSHPQSIRIMMLIFPSGA